MSLQKMWYSSWSIVSSFIVENITEIQVNNPTPGYRMETEHVLLGKLFYNQNGLDTPCDKSQTQQGERFFLNIQFGIQEIITVNLPFKSTERTSVQIMLMIYPLRCFVHQVLWALSRSQIFRIIYWVKEAEQKGVGSKTYKDCLPVEALTPGYCSKI